MSAVRVKDYYAVLGLDQDASPESIRLAYRRLAREHHPDRASHIGKEATEQASMRMAELNEAYSVLSNSQLRRDYDMQWQATYGVPAVDLQAALEAIKEEQQRSAAAAAERARARPNGEAWTAMARQFAEHLGKDLQSNRKIFPWREVKLEGFEWGLHASFLLATYCVAMRSFGVADRAAVDKFTNYANFALARHRRRLKANYFLFVMGFQRIAESDQVVTRCRRFVQTTGRSTLMGTTSQIVLIDASQGRSVLCGPAVKDKRFNQLLQQIRVRGI